MKIKLTLVIFALGILLAFNQEANAQGRVSDLTPNKYLFVFDEDVPKGAVETKARAATSAAQGKLTGIFTEGFKGFSAFVSPRYVQDVQKFDDDITFVTRSSRVTAQAKVSCEVDPSQPKCQNGGGGGGGGGGNGGGGGDVVIEAPSGGDACSGGAPAELGNAKGVDAINAEVVWAQDDGGDPLIGGVGPEGKTFGGVPTCGAGIAVVSIGKQVDGNHDDLVPLVASECETEPPLTAADCTTYGAGNPTSGTDRYTGIAGVIAARAGTPGGHPGSVIGVAPEADLYTIDIWDSYEVCFEILPGLDYCVVQENADTANLLAALEYVVSDPNLCAPGVPPSCEGVVVDLGPFGVASFGTSSSWTCGDVGPATEEQLFHEAFCNYADMGLIMVAAAGDQGDTNLYPPALYTDEVITVAASDLGGTRFLQSNYGPEIAVSAPGGDLITTADGGNGFFYKEVDLATEAGTGIASPHVSGAIALCLTQPNAVSDVDWVRSRLAFDPNKLGDGGKGQNSTKGMLDVPTFVENCNTP